MTIDKEVELLKKIAREQQSALRYVLCDPRASDEALRGHIMASLEYIVQLDAIEPAPPLEHKKCPNCRGPGVVVEDGKYWYSIECINGCFRTRRCGSKGQAYSIWDTRANNGPACVPNL